SCLALLRSSALYSATCAQSTAPWHRSCLQPLLQEFALRVADNSAAEFPVVFPAEPPDDAISLRRESHQHISGQAYSGEVNTKRKTRRRTRLHPAAIRCLRIRPRSRPETRQ